MILKFDDRDGLKVISNESMDLNDPKEFDDPQLFHDQLEVWTLTIHNLW